MKAAVNGVPFVQHTGRLVGRRLHRRRDITTMALPAACIRRTICNTSTWPGPRSIRSPTNTGRAPLRVTVGPVADPVASSLSRPSV